MTNKIIQYPDPMTKRQLDILSLMEKGLKDEEVAKRLRIKEGTVRAHVAAIYKNLNVHTRIEAIAFAASTIENKDLPITQSQLFVLRLMASGLTNKEIAHRLSIAKGTVNSHVTDIYRLFKINNRSDAIGIYTSLDLEEKIMQQPILKERTDLMWQYIKQYMLDNDGNPPAIRDFIRDKVAKLTSTSLVQYHLEKLEEAGLIEMVYDGERRRRIKIPSGIYRLPVNVIDDIILTDGYVRIEVDNNGQMLGVIDDIFTRWDPPAENAVIVTDNPNVAMIAMGLGLMVTGKEGEARDEDEGNNS